MATKKTKTSSTMLLDWSSGLPEELMNMISEKLEDCFDVVHARSVCTWWRSKFPFPAGILRERLILPSFLHKNGFTALEKVPLFLFRTHTLPIAAVSPCEFFVGGLVQDGSEDQTYPLQCSVQVNVPKSDRTSINMLDCQIIPVGYHYRMARCGWYFYGYRSVGFIPLNEDGTEFVVIVNYVSGLLALTSAERKWKRIHENNIPDYICTNLVTFRGQFYTTCLDGRVVVINPRTLVMTCMEPSLGTRSHLVPCGDDELYLVEKIIPVYTLFKVSKLDVKTGTWVEVDNLGDRVFFINSQFGNFSCLAKDLPHGCGMAANSMLFIGEGKVTTYFYKIGIKYRTREWRPSGDNRLKILPSSSVLNLHVVW